MVLHLLPHLSYTQLKISFLIYGEYSGHEAWIHLISFLSQVSTSISTLISLPSVSGQLDLIFVSSRTAALNYCLPIPTSFSSMAAPPHPSPHSSLPTSYHPHSTFHPPLSSSSQTTVTSLFPLRFRNFSLPPPPSVLIPAPTFLLCMTQLLLPQVFHAHHLPRIVLSTGIWQWTKK